MKHKIYNVFLVVFTFLFASIIMGTIFDNKSLISNVSTISIIIGTIFVGLIIFILYKYLISKLLNISLKKEIIIVTILLSIIIIIQCLVFYYFKSYPGWDWNDVFNSARLFASGHADEIDNSYFQMFPNNNALLYFEIIIFKVLSIFKIQLSVTNCLYATIIVNILLIDISIVLMYFTVRIMFDKSKAILSLIIAMICCAFTIYVPVFYTDTVTMMFPIFILLCYSIWQKKINQKNIDLIFILMAFISVFGIKLKFTVIIMIIAILIDMVLKYDFKRYFKPISIISISMIVFYLSFGLIEKNLNVFSFDISNNNKKMPYTHWIMMGMTERDSYREGKKFIGWYNPDSVNYTLSYKTTDSRKNANVKKIKEQFKDYGVLNYTTFLYRKMLFTWSDGTYYAPALLNDSLMRSESLISNLFQMKGKYINITVIHNTSLMVLMYIMILIGAIKSIRKKENKINVCYISLFGVLLFFLLWESSSRYLINYMPIIIVSSMNIFTKRKRTKLKNEIVKERSDSMKKEKNLTPTLYVVVPCYNEEAVLEETTKQLKVKMEGLIEKKIISNKSKVMYVNDGSKDKTWNIIKDINKREPLFTGISLSRNRGHQNALLGGLMTAKNYADVIISMDADLQDDINAIDAMLEKYKEGNEIVYGVRSARKKDTWFKRVTAEGFYKFMKFLGVDCVYNHADYRLTSKKVLENLEDFSEVNLFLRGMFPLIGYKSDVVYYERNERFAGESKYPLKKMLNFAWDGITSFSVKPLRFICTIGFIILFISFIIMFYSLIRKLTGNTIDGWTFLSISIWFIGGIQMISIGIIGEYIGKVYSETKARPRFIISENLEEK